MHEVIIRSRPVLGDGQATRWVKRNVGDDEGLCVRVWQVTAQTTFYDLQEG